MADVYDVASNRHYYDAKILKKELRYDNALYHALFAIECGLKQIIKRNHIPKADHNLVNHINEINQIMPAANALPQFTGARHRFPHCRYANDGYATEVDVDCACKYWEDYIRNEIAKSRLNGGTI